MSIEEKYDEIRQLIILGKEKGYLLYDEVNDLLPAELTSSEEFDDLFITRWAVQELRSSIPNTSTAKRSCSLAEGEGSEEDRARPHTERDRQNE